MIQLLSMTATFGRLDNETLHLTPGLNVFIAPNEAGKSTWAAFLTAMFYGIDTGERAKKGTLPAKLKYKPWNGKPMEGVMRLLWDGRDITVQRQSDLRTPMGKFTTYDTQTGETIPELTAENCGRTLLGVESSVFVRSAFIGQNAIAVSPDAGLEQKLSGLITTGDETVSYSKTERRLRDWKNHIRHNKTGYLPEAEAQLDTVTAKLETIRRCHSEDLDLHVRKQALLEKAEQLRYIETNLKASENQQKRKQLLAAEETAKQAADAAKAAEEAAAQLPSAEQIRDLERQLDAYLLRRNMAENTPAIAAPLAPEAPEVFRGMTPEQAQEKAAKDAETLLALGKVKKVAPIWLLAVIFAAFAGAAAFFLPTYVTYAGLAASIASLIAYTALAASLKKTAAQQQTQADAILQQYGADSRDQLLLTAAKFGESQRQYAEALTAYEKQTAQQAAEQAQLVAQEQQVFAAVRSFAANIYTLDDAKAALERATQAHKLAEDAALRAEAARNSLASIRLAVGDAADTAPEEDFSDRYSLPQVQRQLDEVTRELSTVETTLAQHMGQVQSLGDPAALEAEKQQLESRVDALKLRETALIKAMAALEEANGQLRSRFSPQITKAAGDILCRMTGGRYDAMRMEQDLTLHAKQTDEAVTRELLALSGGTGDQLYLALRLAICDLALEKGTPLVLDDALVYFDDDRLARTMEVLKDESEQRQIILFSCQSREANCLVKSPRLTLDGAPPSF